MHIEHAIGTDDTHVHDHACVYAHVHTCTCTHSYTCRRYANPHIVVLCEGCRFESQHIHESGRKLVDVDYDDSEASFCIPISDVGTSVTIQVWASEAVLVSFKDDGMCVVMCMHACIDEYIAAA